jgi:predicted Zn-dependent peptidase
MNGGPVLLVEPLPGAATAAVGAWIRSGSAHEPARLAGITHLLEHLLLRRCGERDPEAIAEQVDSLGGAVDAFTTRDCCAITAHVPADRLAEAGDLVLDALFDPRPLPDDVSLEQRVIAAEFDLVQDSPAEVAAEKALEACWGDHPLARPVMGRREVVRDLAVDDLVRFHRERFVADHLVLVVVGAVPDGEIDRWAGRLPRRPVRLPALTAPAWRTGFLLEEREGLEQIYANLVLPGLPSDHEDVMALGVLHQLLGAGNSSRLFRELRDHLGLAYEVDSSIFATAVAGVLEVTFSCPVRVAERCWSAVLQVLEDVARGGIAEREVELARRAIAAGLVLGAEGTDALMAAHAGELLARHRRFDAAQLRRELDAVTVGRVRELAADVLQLDALAGAVCGPHGGALLPASLARSVA